MSTGVFIQRIKLIVFVHLDDLEGNKILVNREQLENLLRNPELKTI